MYNISFRRDLNLLDIAWNSPFTPDVVEDYASDLLARFKREGFAPGYRLRMDMSGSWVQPKEALPAFATAFRDFPKASRIAIITPSAITRMQVRRIMTQPYLEIFSSPDEGLNWLIDQAQAGRPVLN